MQQAVTWKIYFFIPLKS